MASQGMPPDIMEMLVDFEELGRLQTERRRAAKTFGLQVGMADEQLAEAFQAIGCSVEEGLTLTASACLAGVTRRTLAAWVRLADDRRPPWAGWLDALMSRDAAGRRRVLGDLRKLAAVDSRAFRDLANQLGRPSPLEYEVEGLRRSKTAALDVLVMPSDAERNRGTGENPASGADQGEGASR